MTIKGSTGATNFYVGTVNKRAKPDENTVAEKQIRGENTDTLHRKADEIYAPYKGTGPKAETAGMSLEEMHRRLESAKQEGDTFEVLAKCLRIAFRIIRGDNVPPKDDRFLFENYPDMHFKAWSLRQYKEDPEDCESELEDEEEEEGSVQISEVSLSVDTEINMLVESL
ncbi:MAG: hypothetical protein FWG70_07045 [Oscillospiraceae bacterium]|nr:hypothetical protein [Oscillospiraceae bacterium]